MCGCRERSFFIRSITMCILLNLTSHCVDARHLNHFLRHYLRLDSKPSNALAFHPSLLREGNNRPDADAAQIHDNRIKSTQNQPEDFLFIFDDEHVLIHGANYLEDDLSTNRLDDNPTSNLSEDNTAGSGTAEENNLNQPLHDNNDEAAVSSSKENLLFPNRNIIAAPKICAEGERADAKGKCKLVIP